MIYPYTIWADLQNLLTVESAIGHSTENDLFIRTAAAIFAIHDVMEDFFTLRSQQDPFPLTSDIIAICLPEFVFRGVPSGYYLPSTIINAFATPQVQLEFSQSGVRNQIHYKARKLAAQVLLRILCEYTYKAAFSRLRRSNNQTPFIVAICFGTVPIGSGQISNKYTLSNEAPIMKIDNFALIAGGECPYRNDRRWQGAVTPKRLTSKTDYLEDLPGQQSGFVHTMNDQHLTRISPAPHRGITTYSFANDMELAVIPKPEREVRDSRTRGGDPEDRLLLEIFRPPPYNSLFITSSICLDYLEAVGLHEITGNFLQAGSADILFVPSVGATLESIPSPEIEDWQLPDHPTADYYRVIKPNGIAICADGLALSDHKVMVISTDGSPIALPPGRAIRETQTNINIAGRIIARDDAKAAFNNTLRAIRWERVLPA